MTALTPAALVELLGVPLTDEQLAAVTAPLEPGVIVAGAGSGKTTVMAARVLWLVLTEQVLPHQVLGLTFTAKATSELAARVRTVLLAQGVDLTAGEPQVSTYHSFAGRLLAEHGLRIGVEPQARLLADANRYLLAARVLRAAPGPYPHLEFTLSTLVTRLLALDGELSEHLVPSSRVRAHDRALLTEFEGLAKTVGVDRERAQTARARLELLDLVERYRTAKAELGVLDFADQVALARRLAQDPVVQAVARGTWRVVLLDEYQDTSVAQRDMLVALLGGGHPVTAVGDPCQAIYGWRGASPGNLDRFVHDFPATTGAPSDRRSLARNNRSGGRLLQVANTLAEPLRRRHPGVVELVPRPEVATAGRTTVALHETWADEVEWVADTVASRLTGEVPAGEVAVLVRTRRSIAPLHAALVARGVPVEVVGLGGLLDLPEVADTVAALSVLDAPTANSALLRLLAGPRWRIGPRDLALLGRRAAQLVGGRTGEALDVADALADAAGGSDPVDTVSLSDALSDLGELPFSDEARQRLTALAAELRRLRRHTGEPLPDLLHRVVTTTGLDVELAAMPRAVAAQRTSALDDFAAIAARFTDTDGSSSLTAFLAYLAAEDEFDRGLETAPPVRGDAVALMTVHAAKGLEWHTVVLPDLTDGVFPSARGRERWTSNAHVLPYDLRGDSQDWPSAPGWGTAGTKAFKADCDELSAAEERRLGYVAVTRAKSDLVASSHWWGPSQKKPRGPSEYLQVLHDHAAALAENAALAEDGDPTGVVARWQPRPDDDATNPALAVTREHEWPRPLEPVALAARRWAAEQVQSARRAVRDRGAAGSDCPEPDDPRLAGWDTDAEKLLAEAVVRRSPVRRVLLPATLTASQVVALHADPAGLAATLARPLPRRPVAAARRGTAFHEWVESHYGQRALLDLDDELGNRGDTGLDSDAQLQRLVEGFLASPYAARSPDGIEVPFELVLAGGTVRGRIDAVFGLPPTAEGLPRWEVVDWKTGRHDADDLQLAVYRLAWSRLQGVPAVPERVEARFLYLPAGRVVTPQRLADAEELAALLAGRDTQPGLF